MTAPGPCLSILASAESSAGWIVGACSLAVFVAWLILRASPPLLPPVAGSDVARSLVPAQTRTENFVVWFIVMRWIAVLCAATLVFITVKLTHLLPDETWWPLNAIIFLLALLNFTYSVALRRGVSHGRLLLLQVYADLALLTSLLHFSGGLENPLSLLMLLHVIIGGIVLSRRQCYGVATVATLLVAGLAAVEASGIVKHYTLGIFPHHSGDGDEVHASMHSPFALSSVAIQGVFFYLTAFFVSRLASRLRYDERQLESMAERAVAERQLLERALDTTGTALRVLDADLSPEFSNGRWDAWFAPGGDVVELLPRIEDERAKSRRDPSDGAPCVSEVSSPDRSNARTFQLTTARLAGRADKPGQTVELVQDISAQKEVQAQILQAGRLAAVGELAGHVAHEVNNPIAIISGKARLLLSRHRESLTPVLQSELEKIVELADRVARIAQRLLSSSRPAPALREPIDVRAPLRKVLDMMDHRARGTQIDVVETASSDVPRVHANAQEMEQVFLNLVLNSFDAMPDGGTLTIEVAPGTTTVDIRIRDSGAGVPVDVQSKIFEPFLTTKSDKRGTGLGLPISRRIVGNHGGELLLVESSSAGSTFLVSLPALPPKESDHG